jgi:hypothetical protein
MSSKEGIREYRRQVKDVVTKIKRDEAFARKAQDDPVGTLEAEGLPKSVISDFLVEEGFGPLPASEIEDVPGLEAEDRLLPALRCLWTCLCTPCCLSGSCWITI